MLEAFVMGICLYILWIALIKPFCKGIAKIVMIYCNFVNKLIGWDKVVGKFEV